MEENKEVKTGTEENKTEPEVEGSKLPQSQEELDALLQSYADKRVSQALKTAERKNADKLREAQKLAQMNEDEKYRYELEQREHAIAEKEKQLALAENKNEASKILAEKGISLQLVDFVVAEDAETMKANIDLLDKAFKLSVKQEVEKRLAGNAPKKSLPLDEAMTQEKFNSLSTGDLLKLYKENPEIFNTFNK